MRLIELILQDRLNCYKMNNRLDGFPYNEIQYAIEYIKDLKDQLEQM